MVRSLRLLVFGALLAFAAVGSASQRSSRATLLNDESVKSLQMALRDIRAGKTPRAEAVLKDLLLDRVRVSIEAESLDTGNVDAKIDGVRDGIDVWAEALPDSPFEFAGPDTPADVVVRFVPRIDREAQVQGLVRAERQFYYRSNRAGYILNGEILIRDTCMGRRLTRDEISRVAAHELGHLLGLDDRYASEGLMGAFSPGPGRMGPTPSELAAVRKFRSDTRNALERIVAAQKARKK